MMLNYFCFDEMMYSSILRGITPKLIFGCYKEFDRLYVPFPKVLADQSLVWKVSQQPRRQTGILDITLEIWLYCSIEPYSQHGTELFICNVHPYARNHSSCLFVSPGHSSQNLQDHCPCHYSCVLKGMNTFGMFFLLSQTQKTPNSRYVQWDTLGKKQTEWGRVSRCVL